jgi:hypothetical protein
MAPPPGFVAYGTPGVGSGAIKNIGGIAKALVILQCIMLASSVLVLILQLVIASKATDFENGTIDLSDFEDSLAPVLAFGLLLAAVAIGGLVVLIIWSFRIAGNLRALGRDITWKPGLTIVAWLLGGCTFNIITFLMLNEHWKASDPEVRFGDQRWKSSPVSSLIVAWFVLTLAQVALAFGSGFRNAYGVNVGSDSRNYADALADHLPIVLLAGAAGIASSVLMIMIIRSMTARHMRATREA